MAALTEPPPSPQRTGPCFAGARRLPASPLGGSGGGRACRPALRFGARGWGGGGGKPPRAQAQWAPRVCLWRGRGRRGQGAAEGRGPGRSVAPWLQLACGCLERSARNASELSGRSSVNQGRLRGLPRPRAGPGVSPQSRRLCGRERLA